ncbi:ornithine cyclodeaminase family protein [Streptomyces sp. A7024]|uniref:Ornithine cyclodeaminase family protein n=1 Tax=Streptomyces coryli TaxID=1128680 RepID=A0A6G4TUG1_9ACTN|nr:ornithine cyclodeaminase family protein [Streptomyces coryli]NGN63514.1 ornithine cyclodeaminase family protein [Streptomyces coryli]
MAPRVFGDDDVRRLLDAETAVAAVRRALLAHHDGTLHAPPRVFAELGDGPLAFTAGELADAGLFGFRAYDMFAGAEQLVAVWERTEGTLRAVVHGAELGPRRTGAIGAVALDAAARPGPLRLGLVGAGIQAWAQLWACAAVRELADITVHARRQDRAAAFAERARAELDLPVRAVPVAADAVRDRDAVILATSSATPVIEADWIGPGTHVTALGPKTRDRHELPDGLAERASVVLTDSRAQSAAFEEPFLDPASMTELGAVLAGAAPGRSGPADITLFSSVGLAGTEVAVAAALYESEG